MGSKVIFLFFITLSLISCEKMEILARKELDSEIQKIAKKRGLTIKDCNVKDTVFEKKYHDTINLKGVYYTLIYSTNIPQKNQIAAIGGAYIASDGELVMILSENIDYWKDNNCD